MRRHSKQQIRAALAQAIYAGRKDIVAFGVKRFGVSRQTISSHLAAMIKEGILDAHGRTRGRVYSLRILTEEKAVFDLSEQPAEHEVWRESVAPLLSELPKNVFDICNYGFTEIFNNAVEHSEGTKVVVVLELTYVSVGIRVHDDGVGVFRKIKDGFKLSSERDAILELAKGKVTTDPESHSGEGIFFTSRIFDEFIIGSGCLGFSHNPPGADWLVDIGEVIDGTSVKMQITTGSQRTVRKVFDHFTSDAGSPTFDKTQVPVGLLCIGDQNVVSRSQARRLLAGMDQFKEIMLGFNGVEDVGQAFADEVFRVFQNQHPTIVLKHTGANKRVKAMIYRAINTERA